MNTYLYLVHGDEKFFREGYYSIKSLLTVIGDKSRIVVMTDKPYFFNKYFSENEVKIFEISKNLLSGWLEEIGSRYVFITKIKALQLFFENYDSDVIFLDTDIAVLKGLDVYFDALKNNKFVMGLRCSNILNSKNAIMNTQIPNHVNSRLKVYNDLLTGIYVNGKLHKVCDKFVPYNSGVIGISRKYAYLLPYVDDLTQYLFRTTEYMGSEEIAFSVVLQEYGEVMDVDKELVHYFRMKETRYLVGTVLKCLLDEDQTELDDYLMGYGYKGSRDIDIYNLSLDEVLNFIEYLEFFKKGEKPYYDMKKVRVSYNDEEYLKKTEQENLKKFIKWHKAER